MTEKSIRSSKKILTLYEDADIYVMKKHEDKIKNNKNIIFYEKLSDVIKNIFYKYNYIIFIMATGIVVRHISPYVNDKTIDPAIIVCDEKLKYAISLLSGHIGGANKICNELSKIDITPVITTATDINNKGALDNIATFIDAFSNDDKDIYKKINYEDITGYENKKNYIKIIPKKIVLGIGCKKYTDNDTMQDIVFKYLEQNNISKKSIQIIASIDIKKDEKALIKLSDEFNANFIVFSADEIKKDKYYNTIEKNDFVASITGVNSVSLAVVKMLTKNNIIGTNYKGNGITIAMGILQ